MEFVDSSLRGFSQGVELVTYTVIYPHGTDYEAARTRRRRASAYCVHIDALFHAASAAAQVPEGSLYLKDTEMEVVVRTMYKQRLSSVA